MADNKNKVTQAFDAAKSKASEIVDESMEKMSHPESPEDDRIFVAQSGIKEVYERLINDPSENVRSALAEFSDDKTRQKLIKDSSYKVRAAVAQFGTDKQRGQLIEDPSHQVRSAVAQFGTDKQQDILFDNEGTTGHPKVVETLAKYGNDFLKQRILDVCTHKDANRYMGYTQDARIALAEYGTDDMRQALIDDVNPRVRSTIARFGNDEHREVLHDDSYPQVRISVARFGNDEIKEKMTKDHNPHVVKAAEGSRTPQVRSMSSFARSVTKITRGLWR